MCHMRVVWHVYVDTSLVVCHLGVCHDCECAILWVCHMPHTVSVLVWHTVSVPYVLNYECAICGILYECGILHECGIL